MIVSLCRLCSSISISSRCVAGRFTLKSPVFSSQFPAQLQTWSRLSTRAVGMAQKPKVFVTRPDIPKVALDLLREKCEVTTWAQPSRMPRETFLSSITGVDGIFCCLTDAINAEVVEKAGRNLKVIATMSVGYDHIDASAVKAKGIRSGYTPDVLTDSCAELTVAILLAASRRLFEAHQKLIKDEWASTFWGPTWMCGQGLAGSTVGIFGLGRIGAGVMARLAPFNVKKFLYTGRSKKNDVVCADFVDFDTLLRESDFIIVTAPLTAATKEIFNARAFSLMKSTAVFVNSSRGGLVQQDALIHALRTRQIFAAGLDVMSPEPLPPDHELTKLDNCVVIPHIGSATVQSREQMAMITAKNILAVLLNEGEMPAEIK